MNNFWFYIQLGLDHVLDFSAYDHILFLTALALPFTFRRWKQLLLLATVFTITHCLSLGLSAYGVLTVDVGLIEFLIPITIFLTAAYNLMRIKNGAAHGRFDFLVVATSFFGLIHGFGFSNYFKMLMAGEEDKLTPLLGFATGIELSQVSIILMVLVLAYLVQALGKVKQSYFILTGSVLILLMTIPMLVATYPW